jgi:hypothetical protein
MIKFDVDSGSKGEWFPFFGSKVKPNGEIEYLEPEKDAGRVRVRLANSETMERIQAQTRKKAAEFVFNPKSRQMDRVTYTEQTPEQEKLERELIWDHAIQEWENIFDSNDNPIPCTLENKMKLMNNQQFARFIGRCFELLTGTDTTISEKN